MPITSVQLDCGLALVVEPNGSVSSAALSWLLPVGAAADAEDRAGEAAMLGELIFRGAGGLSSREHSDALDRQGVRRGSHILTHHLGVEAALLGGRLEEALPLITAFATQPALPADAIEPVRSLCLQSIEGLDDDPQHLVMLRLRERALPPPCNRHGYGDQAGLAAITGEELRRAWADRCRPGGSILGAAGAVDPDDLARRLDDLLDGWRGDAVEPVPQAPPERGVHHLDQDTAQVHIGLAFDAPAEPDEHSMLERVAVAVLGGSTSGRLFTEVRQKRALCYSVGASYGSGRDRGLVTLYAGTTPARASETLEVCIGEIRRLREGASEAEFRRAVVGLKSHLIMQGESTPNRAAALARDRFRLGRARTLGELAAEIDAVTLDGLNAYLARREVGEITVASIGPEAPGGPAAPTTRGSDEGREPDGRGARTAKPRSARL